MSKEIISLIKMKDINLGLLTPISDAIAEYCVKKGYPRPVVRNTEDGMMEVIVELKNQTS